jgi:hypothetical protein
MVNPWQFRSIATIV